MRGLFPDHAHYTDTYHRCGLLGPRSVLAHNVHAGDAELDVLAQTGTAVAHCPSSNSALGSGLFPLRRHVERGVRVALGTDVGARDELLAAPRGAAGVLRAVPARRGRACRSRRRTCCTWRRGPARRRSTWASRSATCRSGKQFDAVWVRPGAGSTLDVVLGHADDADDALAKVFALGGPSDVRGVWVGGDRLR